MTNIDGITATQKIREYEKEAKIEPTVIYAITGHSLQNHKEACEIAGMNGFLSKPVEIKDLNEVIQYL